MRQSRKPTNTASDLDSELLLLSAMVHGASGAIERQEAQGQRELVKSDTLPTEMSPESRATLEAAGVRFIGHVEGDGMFQYVELPAGWSKKPTDHSMWSELVDDKGRKRAGIFYKAAFYDRRAHLSVCRRFNLEFDYDRQESNEAVYHIKDGNTILHTTTPIQYDPSHYAFLADASDKARTAAVEWLSTNYPDFESASAYWD